MRVSDFSVPRRMSGSAYWVLMAKELREFAGLFVLLVIVNITGDKHTFSGKILLAFHRLVFQEVLYRGWQIGFHERLAE